MSGPIKIGDKAQKPQVDRREDLPAVEPSVPPEASEQIGLDLYFDEDFQSIDMPTERGINPGFFASSAQSVWRMSDLHSPSRDLSALGFSEDQIADLLDGLPDEMSAAVSEFARYLIENNLADPESLGKLLSDLKENTILKGGLTPENLLKFTDLHKSLVQDGGKKPCEAFESICKLLEVATTPLFDIIGDIDAGRISFDKVLKIFSEESLGERFPIYRCCIHGMSLDSAKEMMKETDGYEPRTFTQALQHGDEGKFRLGIPRWKTKPPEWFRQMSMESFISELKDMDIEPTEVFRMLFQSDISDFASSKDELFKLLEYLKDNNGIERFGRYSMKILKAARYPMARGRRSFIAQSESDHNNAFYGACRSIEALIDEDYSINLYEVGSDRELLRRADDVARRYGKIDLLAIRGHGSEDGIRLGTGIAGREIISVSDKFILKALGGLLSEDAQIMLYACSTGRGLGFARTVSKITGHETFANEIEGDFHSFSFEEGGKIKDCHFYGANREGRFVSSGIIHLPPRK